MVDYLCLLLLVCWLCVAWCDDPCLYNLQCSSSGLACLPSSQLLYGPATVSFNLSSLTLHGSSYYNFNLTAFRSFYANVCGPSGKVCGSGQFNSYGLWYDYNVDPETCKNLATQQSPQSWALIDNTNAWSGVSVMYIDGDNANSDCPSTSVYTQVLFQFVCDSTASVAQFKNVKLPPSDQTSTCIYTFNFAAAGACPTVVLTPGPSGDNGGDTGSSSSSLSGGWIFLIILFVVTFVYFVGGGSVNYYRGQRGADIVPNKNLWVELPGLVKDGCLYCQSLCSGCTKSDSPLEYDGLRDSLNKPSDSNPYDAYEPPAHNQTLR